MNLIDAGKLALSHGLDLWSRRIVDPPRRSLHDPAYIDSRQAIDAMIRTRDGLGWKVCDAERGITAYRFDGDFEWCGAFASACWRAAGLDPELAEVYFSSTYRLDMYGRERLAFGSRREKALVARLKGRCEYLQLDETSTPADVFDFGPRAGDILLVGSMNAEGKYPMGSHVTVVESFDAVTATFATVEGNATGLLPDGTRAQGVVRQTRPLGLPASGTGNTYIARRLIRPALEDLAS